MHQKLCDCKISFKYWSQSVDNFLTCTVESREKNPYVVMRNVRQFMTGLKNYLTRSGEADFLKIVEDERQKVGNGEGSMTAAKSRALFVMTLT